MHQPLIELRVLRQRAVLATNTTGLLIGLAMFSGYLLIPQIAQAPESTGYGLGASVTRAGLLLAPSAVGQLVAGPVAGRLGVRIGFRTTLVIGALFSFSAFTLLAFLHDRSWHLVVGGLLLGMGIAFAFASMANLIVAAVEQSEVGIATGINTVTRTVGGAFGSALSTAVLASTIGAGGLPSAGGYRLAFGLAAAHGAARGRVCAARAAARRGLGRRTPRGVLRCGQDEHRHRRRRPGAGARAVRPAQQAGGGGLRAAPAPGRAVDAGRGPGPAWTRVGRRPGRAARGHGAAQVILVATSAWVEFLRGTDSPADRVLTQALRGGDELGVLDVVRLELLAGAGAEERVDDLRRLLARFTPLPAASPADHEQAAALYRAARRSGETVRSLVDCLVAAAALRLHVPVLARDRDFAALARVSELELVPAPG